MKNDLLLRGVEDFLSHAIVYIGKGQPTNEFGDGRYCSAPVEKADSILRLALWKVEKERRDHRTSALRA